MHNVLNSKDAQTLKQQLEAGVLGSWGARMSQCFDRFSGKSVEIQRNTFNYNRIQLFPNSHT